MERLRIGVGGSSTDVVHINPAEDVAISVIKSGAVKLTVADQGVGFHGAAPAGQQANIADPAGGVTEDVQARTAIAAILDVLEAYGLTATP